MTEQEKEYRASLRQTIGSIKYYSQLDFLKPKISKDSEIMLIFKHLLLDHIPSGNKETQIKIICEKGKPKERLKSIQKNILKYISFYNWLETEKNKDKIVNDIYRNLCDMDTDFQNHKKVLEHIYNRIKNI